MPRWQPVLPNHQQPSPRPAPLQPRAPRRAGGIEPTPWSSRGRGWGLGGPLQSQQRGGLPTLKTKSGALTLPPCRGWAAASAPPSFLRCACPDPQAAHAAGKRITHTPEPQQYQPPEGCTTNLSHCAGWPHHHPLPACLPRLVTPDFHGSKASQRTCLPLTHQLAAQRCACWQQ